MESLIYSSAAPNSEVAAQPTEPWMMVAGGFVCAVLLLTFGALSYTAALSKSATYDEPLHVVSGYAHRVTGDFRLDPEDPALFGFWASLAHSGSALKLNLDNPAWAGTLRDSRNSQWLFCVPTLYRTSGVNGDTFLQQSRLMFTLIGIALGAMIMWWSWQIAGLWAAAFATTLFAFDANFMAHSSLVKNDVMLAMTMTGMVIALWRFGRRGTILSLVGMSIATAAAVNVKFSGVLCGPIIFACLICRALLPTPWTIMGRPLTLRWQKLVAVPAACLVVGIISLISIWACYGFSYSPTNDSKVLLDDTQVIRRIKHGLLTTRLKRNILLEDPIVDSEPLNGTTKAMLWLESSHLLPQAWVYGFMFTYASTLLRSSYLMGQMSNAGWWYYFPCTMLFKTPTATLLAMLAGAIALPVFLARKVLQQHLWTVCCMAVPVVIYAFSAMSSNLNLGLRHILPVYPFIFVSLGAGAAMVVRRWARAGMIAVGVTALLVAVESIAAFPNFIPFFITPSEVLAGGFKLLGDSNLDWGQDLKLLASFQRQHPEKLYLSYFGSADSAAYGVSATYTPDGYALQQFLDPGSSPGLPQPKETCYLAISATNLQGVYGGAFYQQLLNFKPVAVLGKSIYVYKFPLAMEDLKSSQ